MTYWNPMTTEPNDGNFRLYGIHVSDDKGHRWLEVHYVAFTDNGRLVQPGGDEFNDWAFTDFEMWADPPIMMPNSWGPVRRSSGESSEGAKP